MIILINGSINAGKSTVAKLLAKKLPQSALVEIDTFHEMIGWLPIDKAIPLNLRNAVSVIRNFIQEDYEVIVPYPLSKKDYFYLVENLKDLHTSIQSFTLAPRLEKALTNRGERVLTSGEKIRIKHHYEIGIPKPSFGEIIDNTEQTPQQTADYILSKLNELSSRSKRPAIQSNKSRY